MFERLGILLQSHKKSIADLNKETQILKQKTIELEIEIKKILQKLEKACGKNEADEWK